MLRFTTEDGASTTRANLLTWTTGLWYNNNAIGKSNPIHHLRVTIPQVNFEETIMFKSVLAATAAAPLFAGAAFAGPYVNVEANSGFTGSNYSGTAIDTHVGYEGALGESAAWYVQAGATTKLPDGGATDTVPSGKAGISAGLTEQLSAYGEVSFVGSGVAGVDRSYGTKAGLKFTF